jgi:hypothetical protein
MTCERDCGIMGRITHGSWRVYARVASSTGGRLDMPLHWFKLRVFTFNGLAVDLIGPASVVSSHKGLFRVLRDMHRTNLRTLAASWTSQDFAKARAFPERNKRRRSTNTVNGVRKLARRCRETRELLIRLCSLRSIQQAL